MRLEELRAWILVAAAIICLLKMLKCNTKSSYELETLIVQYLETYPKSSIEEIANALGYAYIAVYRVVEGRPGSSALVGLVNTNTVRAIAGINTNTGHLCWLYSLVI